MPYIREIIKDGHPTLRKPAKKVHPEELSDPLFQQLIDDMFATMYDAPGIGLAAPQINISKRLFVVDLGEERDEEHHGPLVFVNPKFTLTEGEVDSTEGCLSVPEMVGDLKRYASVTCTALDRHGKRFSVSGSGLLSRCLQHEMNHLDGILYLDKAVNIRPAQEEHKAPDEPPGETVLSA